jgi:hypothetical protein
LSDHLHSTSSSAAVTVPVRAAASDRDEHALRAGDVVRLRPLREIAATLDEEGRTEKLPFMTEMLGLAGATLRVEARSDKTCDTINMTGCTRSMTDTVHLVGARCNGSAHGGCQAYCLLFFNEQWLERVPAGRVAATKASSSGEGAEGDPTADAAFRVDLEARLDAYANAGPDVYRCQATQLLEASEPLTGMKHYLEDLKTRNVPLRRFVRAMAYLVVNRYQRFSVHHLPERLRIHDGHRFPDVRGPVRDGGWPAVVPLDLKPGDEVEVRSRDEIVGTLDDEQRNRGLWFDEEMTNLCGKRGRVLYRVERLIDESSGRMLRIKKDLYIVSGITGCEGVYHKLCPRGMVAMMREAWLRRV